MFNSVSFYEDTKNFEAYLLIKQRILDECRDQLQQLLLQQLDQRYISGCNTYELMAILSSVPRA